MQIPLRNYVPNSRVSLKLYSYLFSLRCYAQKITALIPETSGYLTPVIKILIADPMQGI